MFTADTCLSNDQNYMNLQQASELLNKATRVEHAPDDISWILNGIHVGEGYFGDNGSVVSVITADDDADFFDDEANSLQYLGSKGPLPREWYYLDQDLITLQIRQNNNLIYNPARK